MRDCVVTQADDDDDRVVERARKNDADAWERLYERAYPRLLAFAARRVDQGRATEMVAETMARAVASIDSFQLRGSGFDPWLFGICRNVIGDHHRRSFRERQHVEPSAVAPADVGDGLVRTEEAAAMTVAYARLSKDERELLDLRVIAGLTAEQTAQVLGKQAGAIRMAQSRALDRLRRFFEEVYR